MKRTMKEPSMKSQIEKHASKKIEEKKNDGNFDIVISTGSTLLDLAISGGVIRGGGLPGGILVEIFGPSGTGKTVLLSEIAGAVQRKGGQVMFRDPEARLNKTFAQMFDLDTDSMDYDTPNTVTELFKSIRSWEPESTKKKVIHGILGDSLAALSTDTEMDKEEGDKMGMRRAKEFSEELRKTARIITQKNYLMVCSNQVRVNTDAGPYGQKYTTPGGEAVGFYSSVRLRTSKPEKLTKEITVAGSKKVKKIIGIEIQIDVYKNSVWKPYRTAPVTIIFDYGIDDIRDCLQYIKEHTKNTVYTLNGEPLDKSIEKSITIIENDNLYDVLKNEVIDLWETIETKFNSNRKKIR